ncbi:MAG: hypothetical protein H6696_18210 [Deferribacteres bacterium]|nr:hypothetical protein [Deferribacteres bacterium]
MMLYINIGSGIDANDAQNLKRPPEGRRAYARALLQYSIALFEEGCKKAKYNPLVYLELPSPPLFNIYYDISHYFTPTQMADSVKNVLGKYSISKDEYTQNTNLQDVYESFSDGRIIPGQIFVNDLIAETLLYLVNTRRFVLQYFEDHYDSAPDKIPEAVTKEINGLYKFWDSWKPLSKLDLSNVPDFPILRPDSKPEDLLELVVEKHDTLIHVIYFMLAHEYGHLIQETNSQGSSLTVESAEKMIKSLFSDLTSVNDQEAISYLNLFNEDQEILQSWRTETAADIIAILSFVSKSGKINSGKGELVLRVYTVLCLVQCLVETYLFYKEGSQSTQYPSADFRFFLVFRYLSAIGALKSPNSETSARNILSTIHKIKDSLHA